MLKTIEATIDQNGVVQFREKVHVQNKQKVLITFLKENSEDPSITLLSEKSLAKDWLRPEEDKAWEDLQKAQ